MIPGITITDEDGRPIELSPEVAGLVLGLSLIVLAFIFIVACRLIGAPQFVPAANPILAIGLILSMVSGIWVALGALTGERAK